jgi:hypothetical protein
MARLPETIDLSPLHGTDAPASAVAPATDYGLSQAATNLTPWLEQAQRTQALKAKVQQQADDRSASDILRGTQEQFEPKFKEAAAAYDGREPGWARGQLAAFDAEVQPVLDRPDLTTGVRGALRRQVDAWKTNLGQRAIDHEGTARAGIVAEQQRTEQSARLGEALIGFNAEFGPAYQALADGYDGSDPKFSDKVLEAFQAAADHADAGADDKDRPVLRQRLNARQVEIFAAAQEVQAKGHTAFLVDKVQSGVNGLVNNVLNHPTAYDGFEGDLNVVLDGLPAALAGDVRTKAMAEAAQARVEGLVLGGDHALAAKELESGRYDKLLPPTEKQRLVELAEHAKERLTLDDYVAREDLQAKLKSNLESLADTGQPIDAAPSIEEVNGKLGPEAAASYMAQVRQAQKMRAATQGLSAMTPAQIAQRLDTLKPKPGDPDYDAKSKAFEATQKQAAGELKAREEDPAGWAVGRSDQVRAAYEAFQAAKTPQDQAGAAIRYGMMTLSAQGAAGIPAAAQRLLPKAQAQALAKSIETGDPAARSQAMASIAGFLNAFRPPAGATPEARRSAQADQRLAGRELLTAGMKPADLAAIVDLGDNPLALGRYVQAVSSEALAKIREKTPHEGQVLDRALRAALGPHLDSLRPLPGAQELEGGRIEMVKRLAEGLMAQGQSPMDAAKHASEVLTQGYVYGPGFRIPKAAADAQGREWLDTRSPATIARVGAGLTLDDMNSNDNAGWYAAAGGPGMSEAQRRAVYADKVTHNGRWVTTGDERGLVLMYPRPDGSWAPALDHTGQPIARDWDTLWRKAGGRPGEPKSPQLLDGLAARVERLGEHGHVGDQSQKGALGPMQVMPDTARQISAQAAPRRPVGLKEQGTIDLHHRPVVHNSDGSISTVRSISVGTDNGVVLIPTVVGDKVVSNQAAIDHWKKTGEHLGIFDSEAHANAYARRLHEDQAAEYGPHSEVDLKRLRWDESYNRSVGKAYLRQMLDRYGWMPELAVAAYNAGPGRVDDWIKRFGDPRHGAVNARDWVQQIPFPETRAYVQRVLGG